MKPILITTVIALAIFFSEESLAQEIVQLPRGEVPASVNWENGENEFFSGTWFTQVVTNVSEPTMEVFRPDPEKSNGTAVVICPGGGLYALSILSEGDQVAQWLADRGTTAFVLKYRLVPTGEDGTAEIMTEDPEVVQKKASEILPIATRDGLNAIQHIREQSEEYGISKDQVGIIGFSAGGAVTMSVAYNCSEGNCPDFIGPVYWWSDIVPHQEPPKDNMPAFIVCASDDPLELAPGSIALYQDWLSAGQKVELHMYAQGGHGFGMRKQGSPSDKWIDRFGDWLISMGWMNQTISD